MATVHNIVIDQGTTFSLELTVTNDDGTAKNLANYTVASQMRKSYDSSSATATFTASVVTGSSGIYKLVLSNSTSADISAGRYVYDIVITAWSTKKTVVEGNVLVSEGVTR